PWSATLASTGCRGAPVWPAHDHLLRPRPATQLGSWPAARPKLGPGEDNHLRDAPSLTTTSHRLNAKCSVLHGNILPRRTVLYRPCLSLRGLHFLPALPLVR